MGRRPIMRSVERGRRPGTGDIRDNNGRDWNHQIPLPNRTARPATNTPAVPLPVPATSTPDPPPLQASAQNPSRQRLDKLMPTKRRKRTRSPKSRDSGRQKKYSKIRLRLLRVKFSRPARTVSEPDRKEGRQTGDKMGMKRGIE